MDVMGNSSEKYVMRWRVAADGVPSQQRSLDMGQLRQTVADLILDRFNVQRMRVVGVTNFVDNKHTKLDFNIEGINDSPDKIIQHLEATEKELLEKIKQADNYTLQKGHERAILIVDLRSYSKEASTTFKILGYLCVQ